MAHTLLDRPRYADPVPEVGEDRAEGQRRHRFDQARAVLEDARTVLERGWLQHGWYRAERPAPRSLLARLRQSEQPPGIDELRRACLVAAVVVAAHGGHARPDVFGRPGVFADAGPALDLLWDALWESRGQAGPPAAGRAAPAEVRVARARDLVRWNDAAGRTQGEVLGLVDQAISRSILEAVGAPRDQRAPVASDRQASDSNSPATA